MPTTRATRSPHHELLKLGGAWLPDVVTSGEDSPIDCGKRKEGSTDIKHSQVFQSSGPESQRWMEEFFNRKKSTRALRKIRYNTDSWKAERGAISRTPLNSSVLQTKPLPGGFEGCALTAVGENPVRELLDSYSRWKSDLQVWDWERASRRPSLDLDEAQLKALRATIEARTTFTANSCNYPGPGGYVDWPTPCGPAQSLAYDISVRSGERIKEHQVYNAIRCGRLRRLLTQAGTAHDTEYLTLFKADIGLVDIFRPKCVKLMSETADVVDDPDTNDDDVEKYRPTSSGNSPLSSLGSTPNHD